MARLPEGKGHWSVAPLRWWQRWRYGTVLEPTQLWSRSPRVMRAFLRTFGALRRRSSPLAADLRSLVSVRVSQMLHCGFCVDMNGSFLLAAGAPEDKFFRLGDWRGEALFSDLERIALEYAEAMSATPPQVTEDLFGRLRGAFSEEAIVELTALVAFQNMSARFNRALDAQAHGFCAVRPAPPAGPAGR